MSFFLWKNGTIAGPPKTLQQLSEMKNEKDFQSWEISPLGEPANRSPISAITQQSDKVISPSRIILEVADTPSRSLLQFIKDNEYELNREFPEQDMIKKALLGIFSGMGLIGGLLSLLSIATFATSYRLVIARSAEHARNLLLLGFSKIKSVKSSSSLSCSLFGLSPYLLHCVTERNIFWFKSRIDEPLSKLRFSSGSLVFLGFYAVFFSWINKRVIEKSVIDLIR